uniref:Uncharacterized protein n=1 Tax=Medicago truncatula TaxID=3880 RepID=A2Q3X1_MEDTR|nr:hypothetical protein MtrDRAFT_AC155890g19v2 [Medicago truncatula]
MPEKNLKTTQKPEGSCCTNKYNSATPSKQQNPDNIIDSKSPKSADSWHYRTCQHHKTLLNQNRTAGKPAKTHS